jgi:hypothetical protein
MHYCIEHVKNDGSLSGHFLGITGAVLVTGVYCDSTLKFYDKKSADLCLELMCDHGRLRSENYQVTEHEEV